MRQRTLVMCALLVLGTSGCDWVKDRAAWAQQQIARLRGRSTAPTPPPADTPRGDTAVAEPPPTTTTPPTARRPEPRRPAPQFPTSSRPLRDQPYFSDDTGTVDPGMSEREVYALWGSPAAVRRAGDYTFLFFQNGCEYTCGTMDLVILQNDQVVDAVVRWPGHGYSGQSSSPPDRIPGPTRPGDTLMLQQPPPTP